MFGSYYSSVLLQTKRIKQNGERLYNRFYLDWVIIILFRFTYSLCNFFIFIQILIFQCIFFILLLFFCQLCNFWIDRRYKRLIVTEFIALRFSHCRLRGSLLMEFYGTLENVAKPELSTFYYWKSRHLYQNFLTRRP